MKYKMPRQTVPSEIQKIISREMKKQKIRIARLSPKQLKELWALTETIKKSGLPKNLICRKLPHNLGRGIFLHPNAEPILKGQLIGSYAGEISLIPQNQLENGSYAFTPVEDIHLSKEEQLLFDKKRGYHPKRLYALMVDALKKGNFTRFINHSEKPNVIAHIHSVPKNSYGLDPTPVEVIYFAKKTIRPGEQLLVSYEDEEKSYWAPAKIKPFPMFPKTFSLSSSLKVKQLNS